MIRARLRYLPGRLPMSTSGASRWFRRGLHTSIELLPQALSETGRRRLGWFRRFAVGLFAGVILVWGGGHLVRLSLSLGQTSAALGVGLG